MPGLLDGPHESRGVTLELAPGCRQCRAGLVAHEQRAAKQLFEALDPRADGGLADVKPLGGRNEIARRHHRQECTRKLGIQGRPHIDIVDMKGALLRNVKP
jgi:hypothetical protein